MTDESDITTSTLAESPNYLVWMAKEDDGEDTYHLELGLVTLHFFQEEWEEFTELVASIPKS